MLRTCRALLIPVVVSASCLALSACGWIGFPYRINVRQGNYVTQEMVAQLKVGMTSEQVRYVMGSPLLVDQFHKDRWDYVYRYSPGYGDIEERHISLFFRNNQLARLEGDVMPKSAESATPMPAQAPTKVIEIGTPLPKPNASSTGAGAPVAN